MEKKRIFLSPPHMGGDELVFIREAFESNYIAPLGPMVDAFEREFAEYVGIKHCVALSSGTAAMHLALRILGVGPGDEVQIGSHCSIYSVSTIDNRQGPVVLKRNCRIGTHSVIMPGVTVGENAVVGAHSIVNRDVPDGAVVAGVPAKRIS